MHPGQGNYVVIGLRSGCPRIYCRNQISALYLLRTYSYQFALNDLVVMKNYKIRVALNEVAIDLCYGQFRNQQMIS